MPAEGEHGTHPARVTPKLHRILVGGERIPDLHGLVGADRGEMPPFLRREGGDGQRPALVSGQNPFDGFDGRVDSDGRRYPVSSGVAGEISTQAKVRKVQRERISNWREFLHPAHQMPYSPNASQHHMGTVPRIVLLTEQLQVPIYRAWAVKEPMLGDPVDIAAELVQHIKC